MAAIGRPRGSRGPERIKSEALQGILKLLREVGADEAAVVRAAALERIATCEGFIDDPQPRNRWILALTEADLNMRDATGSGLRRIADYTTYKPDWGPTVSGVYMEFQSWQHALSEAGLLNTLQPIAHLGTVDGRPLGGGVSYDEDDFRAALAACYEAMRGRRFTWDAYSDFRRKSLSPLPSPEKFTARKSGKSWDQWLDTTADFVMGRGGSRYPHAYAFISRSRAITQDSEAVS